MTDGLSLRCRKDQAACKENCGPEHSGTSPEGSFKRMKDTHGSVENVVKTDGISALDLHTLLIFPGFYGPQMKALPPKAFVNSSDVLGQHQQPVLSESGQSRIKF